MRGEHLINIKIQDKIISRLESANAYSKETSCELSEVRKGFNFKNLLKRGVVVESNSKYYLNEEVKNEFVKSKVLRGIFIF